MGQGYRSVRVLTVKRRCSMNPRWGEREADLGLFEISSEFRSRELINYFKFHRIRIQGHNSYAHPTDKARFVQGIRYDDYPRYVVAMLLEYIPRTPYFVHYAKTFTA